MGLMEPQAFASVLINAKASEFPRQSQLSYWESGYSRAEACSGTEDLAVPNLGLPQDTLGELVTPEG